MSMQYDYLTCLFCHSAPEFIEVEQRWLGQCSNKDCKTMTKIHPSKEMAILNWNKREIVHVKEDNEELYESSRHARTTRYFEKSKI